MTNGTLHKVNQVVAAIVVVWCVRRVAWPRMVVVVAIYGYFALLCDGTDTSSSMVVGLT